MALTATQLSKATALLNNVEFGDFILNLLGRWLDECEYEDFADYENAMRKNLPSGFTFVKGHKRSFGFTFKVEGAQVRYSAFANGRIVIKQV